MSNEDEFGIVGVTLANAFHVERVVAHGGFAIVYRGLHGGFRAPIALKCLRIPEGMTEQQRTTFLERFREEGELLFRLSAAIPEVVRPLHIDAVYLPNGALMPFLALEWLEGEGFDQVIFRNQRERKGGMDLLTVVDMLRPVAHALARAHNFPSEEGSVCVVHRDLKPENLFLCQVAGAPSIKILDYGIAEVCRVAQNVSGVRWSGMNPFTPGYGAPEQWAPDRFGTSGPFTDVWGLAVTMAEALAGKPVIDGDLETMRRQTLDPRRRPTPRSYGAIISNEVEQVFARALAVDPRERTQDMSTFWTELERAAGITPTLQQNGVGAARRSQKRGAMELELPDAGPASIDLDLAVAPESLGAPARGSMASIPAPRTGAGEEEDLPLQGEAPISSSGPQSWTGPQPPSVPPPRSSRSSLPDSRRGHPQSMFPGPPSSRNPPSVHPGALRVPAGGLEVDMPPSVRTRAPERTPEVELAPALRERAPSSSFSKRASDEPRGPVSKVTREVKGRFLVPGLLLAAGVAITLADLVAVRAMGEPLAVGPVRALYVAGPLALAGALLVVWKLVMTEGDDG
jgi:serine/threonine-protein kinase